MTAKRNAPKFKSDADVRERTAGGQHAHVGLEQSQIGAQLRALYAEAEQEPLPSKLIDLLEILDRAEEEAAAQADPDIDTPQSRPGEKSAS